MDKQELISKIDEFVDYCRDVENTISEIETFFSLNKEEILTEVNDHIYQTQMQRFQDMSHKTYLVKDYLRMLNHDLKHS